MTPENLEETFRTYKWRIPFEPFVLETTDGQAIFVDDPLAFGFGEGTVFFVSAKPELIDRKYSDIVNVRSAATETNT